MVFNNSTNKLNEHAIHNAYAMYLHTFIDNCSEQRLYSLQDKRAIMSYDEFKEFYILNILGRSSEFTENIARDYQYLSFDNWSQIPI